MQMTNEEIIRDYRQAADKSAEIRVLAELNVTSRNEIIAILEDAGEVLPGKRRAGKFDGKIKPLYEQGLSDAEIARRLGCSLSTVGNWRKQHGLPVSLSPAPAPAQTDVPHHAGPALTWEIYERIETILSALPADASKCARDTAGNLVIALFRDHVRQRLGGGMQDEPAADQ